MAGFWEDLVGGGIEAASIATIADQIRDEGKDARQDLGVLADEAVAGTTFTPYTVASNLGNVSANGDQITAHLSQQEQALADQLKAGASGMFASTMQPTDAREGAIYDRLSATLDPQVARERLELEDRMRAQGRLGMTTGMYGGAPELFAQEKAIAEARQGLRVNAMEQARQEQLQNANIGSTYFQNSYLPTTTLMDTYQPGVQMSDLRQTGQIAGQNLSSQLGLGGVQTKVNSDLVAANLYGGMFDALAGVGSSFGSRIDTGLSDGKGLWDSIKGAFGL